MSNMMRADLYLAELPIDGEAHDAIAAITEVSKHAWIWIGGLAAFWASTLVVGLSASDRALIAPDGLFRIGALPVTIGGRLFFLVIPPIILGSFFGIHCLLQTIWDEVAKLPAILPSGETAGKSINPWLLNGMVRSYIAFREELSPRGSVQEGLSIVALYAFAPLTLVGFWLRYLNCRDWIVTGIHTAVLVAGIFLSVAFYNLAKATLNGDRSEGTAWGLVGILGGLSRKTFKILSSISAVLVLLSMLAAVVIPEANGAGHAGWDPRVWGARLLGVVGLEPRLEFREEIVSSSPVMTEGKGRIANLNGRNLQYADARRSELVGARLIGARLDFADLTGARLDFAELQHAKLHGINLTDASVRGTHFEGADLRDAVGATDLIQRGAILDAQTRVR